MEIKLGDIIVFKGKGLVYTILGTILKLFERDWDKWGWHIGFLSREDPFYGWMVCEATADGVQENPLNDRECRNYHWLDTPDQSKINRFVNKHLGEKYDVAVYFFTMIQYLLLRVIEGFQNRFIPWHKFTISFPRILDDRWTCWEVLFWFCRSMGKPIQESLGHTATRYPMITDLTKALELNHHAQIPSVSSNCNLNIVPGTR